MAARPDSWEVNHGLCESESEIILAFSRHALAGLTDATVILYELDAEADALDVRTSTTSRLGGEPVKVRDVVLVDEDLAEGMWLEEDMPF